MSVKGTSGGGGLGELLGASGRFGFCHLSWVYNRADFAWECILGMKKEDAGDEEKRLMTRIQGVRHRDETRRGGWSPALNGSERHARCFRETRVRREELGGLVVPNTS